MKRIIFVMILSPIVVCGWWKNTHKLLSAYACVNSKLLKDNLIWKFNLSAGIAQPLTVNNETNTVVGWIYIGAEREDWGSPFLLQDRSGRHFHNPLKIFSEAGLIRIEHCQSSILWAQDSVEQNKFVEGDMTWARVRELYYNALIWPKESMRYELFGELFKGLGHQMHLVQDMGNPEHTRNDNHVWKTIEQWVECHNEDIIKGFCENPIFPDVDLQAQVFDQSIQKNLIPISRLSDADDYNLSAPIPLTGSQQGLAEYSNANFLSDDTLFSSDFPFPRFSGLDEKFPEVITEYVADEKGLYASRKKEGEGDAIDHFLRVSYLQKSLVKTDQIIYDISYSLDSACYKDYASKLIPRSVGYSAALLDYFFRGEIEITIPASDGIYSLCVDPAKGFEKISLLVKNITAKNEEMSDGKVSVVISYRECNGDPFVPNPPIPEIERVYKLYNCSGVKSIPRDVPLRIDVDMSESPLPATAVDVTLTIVYKGDLGAEAKNAVGMGFMDVSEPTPVDLFNNTDKICFNGSYVNYDDAVLWDVVDINPENRRIDCFDNAEINITRQRIKPMYLSFNGNSAWSSNYFFKYESGLEILPGATPHRIFVLTDAAPMPFRYSVLVHAESMENPDACFMEYISDVNSFVPYTNKLIWIDSTEPGAGHFEQVHSPIGYFRGYPFWMLKYFKNNSVPSSSHCSDSNLESTPAVSESSRSKSMSSPRTIGKHPEKRSDDVFNK
jgi:hypothetical protein